jgi:hypothetical protein
MQAQLRPNPTRQMRRQLSMQRMLLVGVIGMQHPLCLAVSQNGKIRIVIDHLRPEYLTVKP